MAEIQVAQSQKICVGASNPRSTSQETLQFSLKLLFRLSSHRFKTKPRAIKSVTQPHYLVFSSRRSIFRIPFVHALLFPQTQRLLLGVDPL